VKKERKKDRKEARKKERKKGRMEERKKGKGGKKKKKLPAKKRRFSFHFFSFHVLNCLRRKAEERQILFIATRLGLEAYITLQSP
jgi:hypothetical protein